ncbi:hypothetical protein PilKf_01971 [Pillotina sp. SPG140]|jgi:hypothetical protein
MAMGTGFFYHGKTLLSAVDPVGRADRTAATIAVREQTLYICPSPLYGYGLKTFMDRLDSNSALLCIELDSTLERLTRESPLIQALIHDDQRFCITATVEPVMLCSLVKRKWGSRSFRAVEMVRLSGGWQLFPEQYSKAREVLQQELATDWTNALTLITLGRRYIRNAIRNMPLLATAQQLPSFGSSPVLVLGAGPSLDSALEYLTPSFGSMLENRSFSVVCVDTCLPALSARNISVDLAVALESQLWNIRDFIGVPSCPLALDLSAFPATAAVVRTPALFATIWTPLHFFDRLHAMGLLPEPFLPLGSVGLSALSIVLTHSSGPVLTAGLDFAFSLDRSHARSTPAHIARLHTQNRLNPLINADSAFRTGTFATVSKDNTPARSDPVLKKYRDLVAYHFAQHSRVSTLYGPGLSLGTPMLSKAEAVALLKQGSNTVSYSSRSIEPKTINTFIQQELKALNHVKAMLCGTEKPDNLEKLIDYCDYVWAHFPEYAGTTHSPTKTGTLKTDFLKRVRAELDPFIMLFEQTLAAVS